MKYSNQSKNQVSKDILVNKLLEKSKIEILDGKSSNFENILQKSKNKYKII